MRAIAFVSRAAALLAAVLLLAAASHAVKREDFKKCDQSGFCTRQRAFAELVATTDYGSPLQLQPGTLAVVDTADAAAVTADVLHTRINQVFALHVDLLRDGVVRARMWEKKFPDARWRGLDEVSLVGPDGKPGGKLERIADFRRLSDPESESASGVYLFELGPASTGDKPSRLALRITSSPLVIELLANGVPVMAINRQGYLNMEHIRAKPGVESQYPDLGDIFGPLGLEEGLKGRLDNGMWEESWKGTHQDTKPRGRYRNLSSFAENIDSV